jgi:hypothetical protein
VGLKNNLKKFVPMSTKADSRLKLARTHFNGELIRVALEDVLVGFNVTVRRSTRRARQDLRILESVRIAKRAAASGVGLDLKQHAVATSAVTKMLHGIFWTLPSNDALSKGRTAVIGAAYGPRRSMRCPEIVLTSLVNVVRCDPMSAIIYKGLCDTRRLLCSSEDRHLKFMNTLSQVGVLLNVQGPAPGFVSLVEALGCHHSCTREGIAITSGYTNKTVHLTNGSGSAFKNFIQKAAKRHLREKLTTRVHKSNAEGTLARKDMKGITPTLDDHAISTATSKRSIRAFIKKYTWFGKGCTSVNAARCAVNDSSSSDKANLERQLEGKQHALWKRHWSTIVTGACRYGDRLHAANITADRACKHPQCRGKAATAEHWLYECPLNYAARDTSGTAIRDFIVETGKIPFLVLAVLDI